VFKQKRLCRPDAIGNERGAGRADRYRASSGNSPQLSTGWVSAAGIGAYIGIRVATLAVGFELGVQPGVFSGGASRRQFA
jgi:hypothetical protein